MAWEVVGAEGGRWERWGRTGRQTSLAPVVAAERRWEAARRKGAAAAKGEGNEG